MFVIGHWLKEIIKYWKSVWNVNILDIYFYEFKDLMNIWKLGKILFVIFPLF